MSNYLTEYIPEKWKILRLEYKDEYIEYLKKENMKKIHKPKIMKKPVKNPVTNPVKPVSVLKNKSDVNKESHRCEEMCVSNKHKCIIL